MGIEELAGNTIYDGNFDPADAKQVFIAFLNGSGRNGISNVIEWLEKSDFYSCPASSRYHGACRYGLLKHSLAVYYNMMKIRNALDPSLTLVSDDGIAVTALLHDLAKVGFYVESTRNVKNNDTGQWEKVPYYAIEDQMPIGHSEKSIIILLKLGLALSDNEIKCLRSHMGGWEPGAEHIVGGCWKDNPLGPMLHMADMAAVYIDKL